MPPEDAPRPRWQENAPRPRETWWGTWGKWTAYFVLGIIGAAAGTLIALWIAGVLF